MIGSTYGILRSDGPFGMRRGPTYTPQCTPIKGLMASAWWYLGYLERVVGGVPGSLYPNVAKYLQVYIDLHMDFQFSISNLRHLRIDMYTYIHTYICMDCKRWEGPSRGRLMMQDTARFFHDLVGARSFLWGRLVLCCNEGSRGGSFCTQRLRAFRPSTDWPVM